MKVKNLLEDSQGVNSEGEGIPYKLQVQFIQPWSNIIAKIKMPQDVFKSFKSLYDTVMKDEELINFGDKLVGQVNSEPFVKSEKLDTEVTFRDFCTDAVRNFVLVQKRQNYGHDPIKLAEFESDKLNIKLTSMWFVNQKPGEYNPVHVHTNCKVSSVMYLRKPSRQIRDRKEHYKSDGMITFCNNSGTDLNFCNSQVSYNPEPGTMYIFPALQHHMVWPYRSEDPNDSRISLSFNADFITKSKLEQEQKNHQKMYEEMKKYEQQKK